LFYTGSRIGSPRSIRIKDFYQDKGFYVLRFKKKGGANQVVPVHPELQTALLHYLDKSDHRNNPTAPLFHSIRRDKNKGEPLSNETFVYVWNKYRKKSGLPSQFTPHSSRATFATTADERGVPIQDIQATLGHANISTTQAYIHSRKQYKDSAVFSVKY
jgi:integrase